MKTFVYSVSIEAENQEEANVALLFLADNNYDAALDFVFDNDEE
jgi:hypothetical protein